MKYATRWIVFGLLLAMLSACGALRPGYEKPHVTIQSFRALPSDGFAPRFEIGLHIVNPNSVGLNLVGIAYDVELDGHRILTGVANNLAPIEAYGEGDVMLSAATDVFGGVGLIADLMQSQRSSVRYDVSAKLDVSGFGRNIRVKRTGELALSDLTRRQ